jgi:hypothetical protein
VSAEPPDLSTLAELGGAPFKISPVGGAKADRLPYPGLRAFRRDEADLFFGRERCIDVMLDRLAATRFLAVLGASGSGKSSLVRTGLLQGLDMGLHPKASGLWRIADFTPGTQPIRNLAIALLKSAGKAEPDEIEADVLAAFLRRGPRAIVEWVDAGHLPKKWDLLILADQFEEVFRYRDYARREERDAFVALLAEAAEETGGRISVVITMRSEYLGACSLMPVLSQHIGEGLHLVARMTRDECRAAIEGPASVLGFAVEPELVNDMLNDLSLFAPWRQAGTDQEAEQLAREADQLPLMQHALNRLWQRAARSNGDASEPRSVTLTLADYRAIGGVAGALDGHGDEILEGLEARFSPQVAALVERVFRALISGPSLALALRRPLTVAQLVMETEGDRDEVRAIVEAFSAPDCNFLRLSCQEAGSDDGIVDIGHESLIRQWSALARWFEREIRASANWSHLAHLASPEAQMGPMPPLSGQALRFFSAWWREHRPTRAWTLRYGDNYEAAKQYLEDSERARRQAATMRRLTLAVASILATFVASAMLASAWWTLEQRRSNVNQAEMEVTRQTAATYNAAQALAIELCRSKGFISTSKDGQLCIARYANETVVSILGSGGLPHSGAGQFGYPSVRNSDRGGLTRSNGDASQ